MTSITVPSAVLEGPPAPAPAHRTLCEAFQATAAAHPERVALRTPGDGVRVTWAGYAERVRAAAGALAALGVGPGDTVGLLLTSRPDVAWVDAAAVHLGAACVSLYLAAPPATQAYVLEDTRARVLVTEAALAGRVPGLRRACPRLEHVLSVDEDMPAPPPGFDFDEAWRSVSPDDTAVLLYTSGTTGAPKGVVHTHANVLRVFAALGAALPAPEPLDQVAFIPFAHAGERCMGHYRAMIEGATTTFCPDPAQLGPVLAEARPTFLFAPPGVWERVGGAPGLDRLQQAVVCGAPASRELLDSLVARGLPVIDMYASTELTPVTATRSRDDLGTVGTPLPGVSVRIGADGEVQVKTLTVTPGYLRRPEQTAALLGADGWAHTGDGGEIDEQGRLVLRGRIDERMINVFGHNLEPDPIEAAIKAESPELGHVCVFGDRRPYVVALMTVGSADAAEVSAAIERANARLPEPARIRRHVVLDDVWSPGGEELTPTMKLRRHAIAGRYADEIERLYSD
jgi:long-chain acyl-CoA synthetase